MDYESPGYRNIRQGSRQHTVAELAFHTAVVSVRQIAVGSARHIEAEPAARHTGAAMVVRHIEVVLVRRIELVVVATWMLPKEIHNPFAP